MSAANWGDIPTWAAAIFAGAAAAFAGYTLRAQAKQINDLREKEVFAGRLMAYQAHSYARELTRHVAAMWGHNSSPSRPRVALNNLSPAAISNISVRVFAGNHDYEIEEPVLTLVSLDDEPVDGSRWEYSHPPMTAAEARGPLPPRFSREWTFRAKTMPADTALRFEVEFTDEAGGIWRYDQDGRATLTNNPADIGNTANPNGPTSRLRLCRRPQRQISGESTSDH